MPRIVNRSHVHTAEQAVWLLDLHWGGRTFRLSTKQVVLTSDNESIPYEGGLSIPDLVDTVSRSDTTPEGQSTTLEAVLDIDVAKHRRRGHQLSRATGDLALVFIKEGAVVQSWENRFVQFSGRVTDYRYGSPERPLGYLGFRLQERPINDRSLLIGASARVNLTTWPTRLEAHEGKVYPQIIGAPGSFTLVDETAGVVQATPAYVIATTSGFNDTLVIAGHRVEASTVTVFDGALSASIAVTTVDDGLGQQISTVSLTSAGLDRTVSEYWIGWNGGGGMTNFWGTGAMSGAGDICHWLLSRSTVQVDHGRWAAATSFLNRIVLGFYLNSSTATSWDVLRDQILPLFDGILSLRVGPDGVYPIVWDPARRHTEAAAIITEGPGFSRSGPFVQARAADEVRNEFRIEFAKRADTADPQRILVLTPDRDASDLEQTSNTYVMVSRSEQAFGDDDGIRGDTLDSDILWDDPSAFLIAASLSRIHGFIEEEADYSGDLEWAWLRAGMQLVITESDAQMTTRSSTIIERSFDEGTGGFAFTLLFDDDPVRDARTT